MNLTKIKKVIGLKNRVNYISGLWFNINIFCDNFERFDIYVNDELVTEKYVSEIEKGESVAFDIYLPANRFAKATENSEYAEFVVKTESKRILLRYRCKSKHIYKAQFEHISDDINFTLSCLPLMNPKTMPLISEYQKLLAIKHIFDAKLEKDSALVLKQLVASLSDYSAVEKNKHLIDLGYNPEFLTILINLYSPVISNPYYVFIKEALRAMMYLNAKSIIDYSALSEDDKSHLYKECVKEEEEKFVFVEYFPDREEDGKKQWESLSEDQKQAYWPMLANAFEHRRQHSRILHYPPDLAWFTDVSTDKQTDAIKSVIHSPETKWFGMSLVVNEWENSKDIDNTISLFQEYLKANEKADYLNIDSFCYIAKQWVDKGLDREQYVSVIDLIVELLNNRIAQNIRDIYRQCLIELTTSLINYGIKSVNWAFGRLAEKVRPYYAFDDYYLNNLNYKAIQAFDGDYYRFVENIFGKTKALKAFVAALKHNIAPSVPLLREQFENLKYLHQLNIFGVEKWILALSRYCQLLEVEELYAELSVLHEVIGDNYGALLLSPSEQEKNRLEQNITSSGKYSKRKDCYWFERAIESRQKKENNARLSFMADLNQFLSESQVQNQYFNDDLVHLLASEAIHYTMLGGKFNDVVPLLPLLGKAYVAGHSALHITNWLVNQEINISSMNTISTLCGEYGEFKSFIEQLGINAQTVLTAEGQSTLLKSIKQHYVYPYLQVMIYSCNAYQNKRHQIIRDSWLPTLKALDIDYCFVVGDAEKSHMDGDIMRLAVPDNYEALPRKSIEMFRFAQQNSHHRYYYKLDDDCVLNVYAMFGDPAFLNHAYFGRIVKRPLGGVDRSWHHKKSSTPEARSTLDLSPEYSIYGDGSTGYILSHDAAEKLSEQAVLDKNAQLVGSSYFEDKLVGDLLAKAHISCTDHGYNCVIRRKAAAGHDVQMWDFGLLPTRSNYIKVLHTEDDEFRLDIGLKATTDYDNVPKLIYRDSVRQLKTEWVVDEDTPVLEKLAVNEVAIRDAKHIAIIVGKNEQELLPNLLKHHREIGIEHFLFIDNCSEDCSIDYMLSQPDVSVFVATQEYRYSRFAVNWQETLLSHYGLGRWVLIIDSDELYIYKDSESKKIHSITQKAEKEKANSFFAPMIDFYPKGNLAEAIITDDKQFYEVCDHYDKVSTMVINKNPVYGPYSNSYTYQGGLRARVFGVYNKFPELNYVNQKYNLLKFEPNMKFVEGLHFMYGHRVSSEPTVIMHFKYHAGFYKKVKREIDSGQHWNGATEYKRYAKKLDLIKNNILFDKEYSKQCANFNSLVSFEIYK